jgi:riboflavin kinase/FMN adenylyltransferase
MLLRGQAVSSSQIRRLLEAGNITRANRLLGYPFTLRGPVVPGERIGRRQTVPTFNLGETHSLLPKPGVYITAARPGTSGSGRADARFDFLPAVTNVGCRPTFCLRDLGVETHLLEDWKGAPPAEMDVCFHYRLRDEARFESAAELREQILRDVRRAHSYFRRLRRAAIPFGWRQQ